MIFEVVNTQGTEIPPGQLLGNWRIKSKLTWPDVPPPSYKAWGEYRKLILNAFGNGNRINNLGDYIKLIEKLGQWHVVETHIQHTMVMNESHCFVSEEQRWKKYKRDSTGKFYQYKKEDDLIPNE